MLSQSEGLLMFHCCPMVGCFMVGLEPFFLFLSFLLSLEMVPAVLGKGSPICIPELLGRLPGRGDPQGIWISLGQASLWRQDGLFTHSRDWPLMMLGGNGSKVVHEH